MNQNLLDENHDQIPQTDPTKDYLEELVGESKKFKDPQALARGKYESDQYIKILERRLDQKDSDYKNLSETYNSTAKLQELVDRLSQTQPSNSPPTQMANEVKEPGFDPNQIKGLVSSTIQEIELNRKQQENFNTVRDRLIERFGVNYQGAVKQHIDSIGVDESLFNQLARQNPTVLFKTLGLDDQRGEGFQAPVRSSQRTDNFSPRTLKRDWAYYENMRTTNRKLYDDPKTAVQMMNDYREQGDAFETGSWKT